MTPDSAKKLFRQKSKELHPDRSTSPLDAESFRELKNEYEAYKYFQIYRNDLVIHFMKSMKPIIVEKRVQEQPVINLNDLQEQKPSIDKVLDGLTSLKEISSNGLKLINKIGKAIPSIKSNRKKK